MFQKNAGGFLLQNHTQKRGCEANNPSVSSGNRWRGGLGRFKGKEREKKAGDEIKGNMKNAVADLV